MILLFLGISGSGKDTQASLIADEFGYTVVSTGDLIRDEIEKESELGKALEKVVNEGDWVDDKVVYDLLSKRLDELHGDKFILTGAVRDENQVSMLDEALRKIGYELHKVILLELPDDVAVERLSGRLYDREGNMYHSKFNPPPVDAKVEVREDDQIDAIKSRIQEFHDTVDPIIKAYQSRDILIRIDGDRTVEEINKDIRHKLNIL